jgi:hypothetical protein
MLAFLACGACVGCTGQPSVTTIPGLPDHIVKSPAFRVTVDLRPRAVAELKRRGETVVVLAYYYGLANPRGAKYSDDMGQIYWSADERIELDHSQTAQFPQHDLNAAMLDYLQDRKPEVLINVVSGRRTDPNNLLRCTVFEDSVYLAASQGVHVTCDLIGD